MLIRAEHCEFSIGKFLKLFLKPMRAASRYKKDDEESRENWINKTKNARTIFQQIESLYGPEINQYWKKPLSLNIVFASHKDAVFYKNLNIDGKDIITIDCCSDDDNDSQATQPDDESRASSVDDEAGNESGHESE